MIKKTFLVEIGTEELPSNILKKIILVFYKNFVDELSFNKILYKNINYFSTPRRLALQIIELDTSEKINEKIKKGPAIKHAFDENGNPTKAAYYWAKSCKINLNQAERLKTKTGEWIIHRIQEKKEKIELLFPKIIEKILKQINLKNTMRWETTNLRFIRPIRNIVMLLDEKIIKSEVFNVPSNNFLYHHISCKEEKIYIKNAIEYPAVLFKKNKIIANYETRKEKIKYEAKKIAKKVDGIIKTNPFLLEEVTSLVESPQALLARFKKDYINYIPKKILIHTIEKQQRCFSIYSNNSKKEILPYFIFISNIKSKKNKEIILGNEKVMHARLSDAMFFLKQDRKRKLENYLPFLKKVSFYNNLGTLYEKTLRLKLLIESISCYTNTINKNDLIRSAVLSKCDLITQMVDEFPELQGTIGMYYALENKENKEVAIAIKEQYLPSFSGDELPSTPIGCLLSISDKIDTLSGMFAIGETPTPEKDPFGLRRAALGILRIIITKKIPIDLKKIIEISLKIYTFKKVNYSIISKKIIKFFISRLSFFYEKKGYSTKVIKSVLSCKLTEPLDIDKRINAISDLKKIESIILIAKRIDNIVKNNHQIISSEIHVELMKKTEEKNLLKEIKIFNSKTKELFIQKKYKEILVEIKKLEKPIDNFFDKVQINHSNFEIRQNRLLLLIKIQKFFLKIANFSYLY
ncbi:glycine--tRNA ligase subunit beta [Buchnera aphidicola]|jgi:glycyl-tRNA synthetase beta chain|uniref:Glycine--tRNA ligase beta subunit n=1 Tax=Buchnera aphidicola subsp. Schizaphis graminum (strain Sg) TaxID=198804 RepID=SYGB_BUCAP|nr:glycine--tRNA ligase subunit beta [Buchnera aphidicola]Q8KA07.1 RecName: Full=Glycine--tRNA ligase beta subunit; AltName: Full=Glycyl-tRNA synthetase beta subunit; Short=GlyRS [Buchnera aphidicola str. Sg (Schizaphis graminum)]AAM67695.1 glycyl-tRNA synthetase beta chain [Buchnera aphidicola str. Sg (Schizaphis graminum)]AWI49969.1 glycine--tRNA ligase subunit beta [Buchnera aphidicola (Schizaphis graminum)]